MMSWRTCFAFAVSAFVTAVNTFAVEPWPRVLHYDWKVKVDYDEESILSTCQLVLKNSTGQPVDHVPVLLYRLLTVDSVHTAAGTSVQYSQTVRAFEDNDRQQVNVVDVRLPVALATEDTVTLVIDYHGYLAGYRETGMLYVQDRVRPEFTILRLDCYAYPEIGVPSRQANLAAGLDNFSYRIRVDVPDSLDAANIGLRVSDEGGNNERRVTEFRSIKPAWRMDVCVAPYARFESGKNVLYSFRADSAGAACVVRAMNKCMDLYTRWFGPLRDFQGFTVIEIPEGFGSQADVTGILQTASAFHDSSSLHELYHELSHQWNIPERDSIPCRWQEGLATFLEFLASDSLDGTTRVGTVTDWMLGQVRKEFATDSDAANIPPAQYGVHRVTGYSYSVGMIMCRVLYDVIGHERFMKMIRTAYQEHKADGLSLRDYSANAARTSRAHVRSFFDDWWFSTRGVDLILSGKTVPEMVAMYRH
jgi:hypothetical protein